MPQWGGRFLRYFSKKKRMAIPAPSRGSEVSPRDEPLLSGEFLSTRPLLRSANLEVTERGDLVPRSGDLSGYPSQESPLWDHRATGSSPVGGEADNRGGGGALCRLESWLLGEGVSVKLLAKNGRWRVGRSWLCTLSQSPKPEGSWRVYRPRNARGRVIRDASLRVTEEQTLVVAAGDDVMGNSASAGQTTV